MLWSEAIGRLCNTVEPLLRGHPDERPPPLEMPLNNVNLNINVLISTPGGRPPLLKGHFSEANRVASQEGFHCILGTISKSKIEKFQMKKSDVLSLGPTSPNIAPIVYDRDN